MEHLGSEQQQHAAFDAATKISHGGAEGKQHAVLLVLHGLSRGYPAAFPSVGRSPPTMALPHARGPYYEGVSARLNEPACFRAHGAHHSLPSSLGVQ